MPFEFRCGMERIKRIGVITSGGDSPGMNAALRAVVRSSSYFDIECYGIQLGYEGLIKGYLREMGPRSVSNIIYKGGTILKTARSNEFKTEEGRAKGFKTIQKFNLDGLAVIGGDGSFTGAMHFEREFGIPCIGIPGTIDNDIFGTDFTIGYDTALNTAMDAVDKIRDTATSHNRLFFVEVMGRDAGFIALNTGIATGAQDILIPEQKDSLDDLFKVLERSHKSGKQSSIIVVSEGESLGGVYDLAKVAKMKFRNYDIRVSVLGHIQRGGKPSCADRVLASRLGVAAVEALKEGKSNAMVGIRSNQLTFTPFEKAIQKHHTIDDNLLKIADILAR